MFIGLKISKINSRLMVSAWVIFGIFFPLSYVEAASTSFADSFESNIESWDESTGARTNEAAYRGFSSYQLNAGEKLSLTLNQTSALPLSPSSRYEGIFYVRSGSPITTNQMKIRLTGNPTAEIQYSLGRALEGWTRVDFAFETADWIGESLRLSIEARGEKIFLDEFELKSKSLLTRSRVSQLSLSRSGDFLSAKLEAGVCLPGSSLLVQLRSVDKNGICDLVPTSIRWPANVSGLKWIPKVEQVQSGLWNLGRITCENEAKSFPKNGISIEVEYAILPSTTATSSSFAVEAVIVVSGQEF